MSVAEWSPFTTYIVGDSVAYAGNTYIATATNRGVAPVPITPIWTLSGGGGGGTTTLSLVGDTITANPGGSSVDVGLATTVAATELKTTRMGFDGLLTTAFDGDLAVNSGALQNILFTSSGDGTFDGTVKAAAIEDSTGSLGLATQVLTAGPAGGSLLWSDGVSQALANKIQVVSASDVPSTPLTYSLLPSPNIYVPLVDSSSLAPTAPSTGTGWRLTKSAPFLAGPGSMVIGTAYTITNVGNTNWLLIGFATATVGTTGIYNGVAITGTTGYATLATNYGKYISWLPLNNLYGLTPPYSVPATAVLKKNMNAVWALVRFNNDLAVQGYISITIETYNYASPPSGSFTGRWAYSFPVWGLAGGSAQSFGGGGGAALTAVMPRAVGGYTYLLYCEDKYPKFVPNQVSPNFGVSNGMFPSQSSLTDTLRDPYDVYPEYPHFPLNGVAYSESGTQTTDRVDVEVASIQIKSTSSPNVPQNLQPAFDFQVLAMGYRGTNGAGTQSNNYTLTF